MWHWLIFISPVIQRPQRLRSSMKMHKVSSTSCVKYFAIINSWGGADDYVLVELLAGFFMCTLNKQIKAKTISIKFLFIKFFFDTKPYFESSHQSRSIKKHYLNLLEYAQENVWKWLFDKAWPLGLLPFILTLN